MYKKSVLEKAEKLKEYFDISFNLIIDPFGLCSENK